MRALVTGSRGFVGRHMVAELERRGWTVSGWDIEDTNEPWEPHVHNDCLRIFNVDGYHQPYDLVVHAAAQSPHRDAIDNEPSTHVYNQLLDAAMFEWALRTGQRRVLYLSSCAVLDYVDLDDYGMLKLTGERMARQARDAGLPVTVVRPFSGYGEDQGDDWPFGAFIARARRREDPFTIWGDGSQVRDWVHIDDVVAGALAVAESGTTEPLSLCTGVGTSMAELVQMVCAEAGYEPEIELRADRPAGVPYRVGDPTALHRYYRPQVTLDEGVRRALKGAP